MVKRFLDADLCRELIERVTRRGRVMLADLVVDEVMIHFRAGSPVAFTLILL